MTTVAALILAQKGVKAVEEFYLLLNGKLTGDIPVRPGTARGASAFRTPLAHLAVWTGMLGAGIVGRKL